MKSILILFLFLSILGQLARAMQNTKVNTTVCAEYTFSQKIQQFDVGKGLNLFLETFDNFRMSLDS